MNQVQEERKEALTKSFAIVGFIAIILFAVWLAVQIVSLIPSAFSSLASIADGVYTYQPHKEMLVSTKNSVNNAGEKFAINWTTKSEEGIYYFSYECVEGVAITLQNGTNKTEAVCETDNELSGHGSVEVIIESEKQRFIDVPYTIRFIGVDGTESMADGEVTIVNASIPTTVAKEEDEKEESAKEPEPIVAGEATTEPSADTPLVAGEPETIEEVIYTIPVSDPNGKIDIAITLLGVGILDSSKNFVRTGIIDNDKTGAFQFAVINLGTKTSNEWSYEANMPSGINYTSKDQTPLKPNEKAIITLGFDGLTQTGIEQFGVELTTTGDVNPGNNSFLSAVRVTD